MGLNPSGQIPLGHAGHHTAHIVHHDSQGVKGLLSLLQGQFEFTRHSGVGARHQLHIKAPCLQGVHRRMDRGHGFLDVVGALVDRLFHIGQVTIQIRGHAL